MRFVSTHPSRPRAVVLLALLASLPPSAVLAQSQPIDEEYTAMITEATTEPFFLTPHVDHLPASTTVPTPLDVLGHIAGQPDVLSYPDDVHGYMRAVADASDRVEVFRIGTSEEGREMIVVVVSNEATIARLDEYKRMAGQLADPRAITDEQARALFGEAKPIYYATGAIHSPETGSPEMLMELVYRLAVDESPFVQEIRDNLIFMTTPIVEVDGRAKVVDLHMAPRKDPDANVDYPRRPLYWGKYVAHDNNRDGMGLQLELTKAVLNTFLEYKPTVLHDLHESASYLYTSTGRGPYNAWIDPIVVEEWNRLAHKEVKDMTAFGVPGVYTHDFYDGWAPNYMFWIANMRNAIGRFYETQGSGDASTRVLERDVERQWHRMNPPLDEVLWNIRNNVNLQQSALLIALHEVATNRREFLENFWLKSKRSVAKAHSEGPAAWVFPGDDPRPGQQARLLSLLQRHGVEVHRATEAFSAGPADFAAGSYVVRMDQPYSRAADMLLDKQYYNPNDPSPYDDTGWTHGPLFNVETARVENVAVLDVPMTLEEGLVAAPGGVRNAEGARAFVINYNADNNLTAFRFRHSELRIQAAERAFEAAGRAFNAGSFIVSASADASTVAAVLDEAGQELGFTAYGVATTPEVEAHDIALPRVAIMHTWQTTQTEGWLRLGFDEYGVPYDYISVHEVRDNPRLRDRYDVIVFGPASRNALSILHGVQGERPIPWMETPLTPNLGAQASTPDMRGGLGLTGVLNLDRFVREGGTFITLARSASLPIHFGLAQGVRIRETENLWAPGGVFRVTVDDRSSPITYGYDDELGVYFDSGPVFAIGSSFGGRGRRGGGGAQAESTNGSTTERRSGRGGIGEEDIPQGRARDLGRAAVEAYRNEHGEEEEDEGFGFGGAAPTRARAVLRFSSDVQDLLISGGLDNGEALANAPALVDVPHGDGHVIMFSFNPFWRGGTLGSYALVFNTLLHHRNLGTGEAAITENDE